MDKKQERQKRRMGNVLLRLWRYLYRYKWMLFSALLLTLVSNAFGLLGPMLSGYAIDAIGIDTGGVNFPEVFYYCGWMIAFYALSSILSYGLSIQLIYFSQRVTRQMRQDIFYKLMELPISFYDSHQTGDIISRINYDIDTVNTSLSNDIMQICTSIITVVGSLAMMLVISPPMTLILVVTIPISVLFTRYRAATVKPLFRKRSTKLGELNGFVEEISGGLKTTKAYHQEETMITRFDEKNEEAVEAFYYADYYGSTIGPSVNFINNLTLALISVVGAVLYLFGSITLGNLSSFVLYSRKFSGPINEMANIISELQSATAAAERVFKLIDEASETEDVENAVELINIQGDVEIRDVTFSYSPGNPVIRDLSLKAESGSLVAIVGPTGAGKTTIINLLMRFYDPDSGTITLDGTDIRQATRKSLRLAYAMVLQDTWMFHGTVFDNIAYGKADATLEDVIQVAKAARIHNYITRLPKGYETILNEDGINISQGQKQLITIARAMLLDAKILILDEATSNVDTQTELAIQDAMRKLMERKTCFVIAHRLSTIQNADDILVVQSGNIVEQGTHKELLQQNGVYSGLYHSQFEQSKVLGL